jgi:TP901 family phage tail tape measure protein
MPAHQHPRAGVADLTIVGTAEVIITPRMRGFAGVGSKVKAELDAVGAGAGGAGRKLKEAEKGAKDFGLGLGSLRSKAVEAVTGLAKLGLAAGVAGAAYALVKGAKAANEFQAEMVKLSTQAGATTAEVQRMSPAVLDLATKVGIGPTGLAQGLYHLESAGFRGTKALNLLTAAAEGSRVGHADLEKTVQAMIAVEASRIKGVHSEADAMGLLNKIVGVGDMRMEGLASAMSSGIVPAAATFGLSMQDVGAALATLTDNAIPPQEAATRLRMTFSLMGAPSNAAAKALDSIHMSATQMGEDMRKPNGLLVALQDLQLYLKRSGLDATQQAAVISRAFGGGRSSSAIMTMLSQMDRLQSKYGQLETGGTSSAQQFAVAWAKTGETTSQRIATMRASFDTLLVRVGTGTQGLQNRLAGLGASLAKSASTNIPAFLNAAKGGGVTSTGTTGQFERAGALARAEALRLGAAVQNVWRIFVQLWPAIKNIAMVLGGAFLVALHLTEGAFGLMAKHGTTLRTVLYVLVGILVANRIATTGLAVAQAAHNIVALVSIARTKGLAVALGAEGAAAKGNLIGTRLLTAAYNSSLITFARTTGAMLAQKTAALAVTVATKAWTVAQWLFNAAMDANVITLVVIGLVALGVGLYEAYKHFKPFREAVQATFGFIKRWWPEILVVITGGAALVPVLVYKYWRQIKDFTVRVFSDIAGFIKRWWPEILVVITGGAALIPVLVYKYWTQIKDFTVRVFSDIVGFLGRHWRLLLVIFTGGIGLTVVLVVNFWKQISGFFSRMYSDVSKFTSRMWHDVAGFFSDMYSDVSGFTLRLWRDVSRFFSRLYSDVSGFTSRMWHDVAGFFTRMYNDASGPTLRLWHDVARFFTGLWRDATGYAARLWHDVAGFFVDLYRDTSRPALRAWRDVAGFFSGMWHDATGFASRLYHDVAGFFVRLRDDVTGSVKTAVGWMKDAWSELKGIFKEPINFVINTVYNGGIRPVWNFLADIVHESHLPPARGLARGGIVPMIPGAVTGRDSVPIMAMPGEAVVPTHLVREMAPWAKARGIPGFSLGGIVGGISHAVTHPLGTLESLGSGALSVLGTVTHWVRGALAAAVSGMLAPVRAAIHGTLGTGHDWPGTAGQLMLLPLDKIVAIARGQDRTDTQASGSAGGAARWANVFTTALALAGQPASWLPLGLKRMNQESGGNPTAVNRTDSNWQRGTPSVGLMQVIGPTFAAYAGQFRHKGPFLYGTSTDPLANIFAAVQYTKGAYGTLSAWGRPGGYDTGNGKRWPSGTVGINQSGEDEFVWRRSQLTTGGSGHRTVTISPGAVQVHLDARGLPDPGKVEAVVDAAMVGAMDRLAHLVIAGMGTR